MAAGKHEPLLTFSFDRAADDAALEDQLGAELLSLTTGPPSQFRAPDAVDEAEEVLDQRSVRRLAAGHIGFDQNGRQSVRCGVHGSGEPGGSRADDRQVVMRARWRRR